MGQTRSPPGTGAGSTQSCTSLLGSLGILCAGATRGIRNLVSPGADCGQEVHGAFSELIVRGEPRAELWTLSHGRQRRACLRACLETPGMPAKGKNTAKAEGKQERTNSERKDTFPGSPVSLLCPCTKNFPSQQQGAGGSQDRPRGPCQGRCSELGLLTSSSLTQIRYRHWNLLSRRSD